MIYYVYRINLLKGRLAGKYYIGQHRTKNIDDGYAGSGTILLNYYKSHGAKEGETYTKDILRFCNSIKELNKAEKELISDLYDTDPNCINLIAGGRGKGFSKETRKKISDSNKGREITEETRKKISDSLLGHPVPKKTREIIRKKIKHLYDTYPEYRVKNSEAHKGLPPISEETRKKIAEANRGRPCCWKGKKMPKSITDKMSESQKGFRYIHKGEELKRVRAEELDEYLESGWLFGMTDSFKKRASEINKGRTISEETRRKISETERGRKLPEEVRTKIAANNRARAIDPIIRKKISDAKKGKKHSPEHIAKVAAAKRGVPQSEESKRKRSEAMKGKHWHFDKQLNKRVYVLQGD